MIAEGWQLSIAATALQGRSIDEVRADAEAKECAAFRVCQDGTVQIFRKIGGEWVTTFRARLA